MMCKKFVSFILALVLFLTIIQVSIAEIADTAGIIMELAELRETFHSDQLADSDQLAEGFIRKTMLSNPSLVSRSGSAAGSKLTGLEAKLYELLKADIIKVANGELSSTVMSYPADSIYEKSEYTFAELGVGTVFDASNQLTEEARTAIASVLQLDMNSVHAALLFDCPYEFYWYDKTIGFTISYPSFSYTSQSFSMITTDNVTVSFRVSADYALNGEAYQFNTAFGQNAKAAAEKARQIVNKYAASSDREKLIGYGNEICALTSYNYEAYRGEVLSKNPWQLIWVFDDDPDTKVVCEGYSKAFQFLCEMTAFSGSVSVISVTGVMAGGTGAGGHMWNLVRLDNGKRLLVDVTNIDEGTAGYPDQLMLAGYTSGNYNDGYVFATSAGNISYVYDEVTKNSFSAEALTLSKAVPYDGMTCITVPDDVKQIGAEAFAGTGSQVIIIPAGCEEIAQDAFNNCAQLKYIVNRSNVEITAPAGVTVLNERGE